jgi:hypothetical protein
MLRRRVHGRRWALAWIIPATVEPRLRRGAPVAFATPADLSPRSVICQRIWQQLRAMQRDDVCSFVCSNAKRSQMAGIANIIAD